MEKGYRDDGHDIDNTGGPLEAGFGFAVAFIKPGGFVGRGAVLARRQVGPLPRRLVSVQLLVPDPLLYHAEVARRNGEPVGYVRAGSYGHGVGVAVGPAMIEGHGETITSDWRRTPGGPSK